MESDEDSSSYRDNCYLKKKEKPEKNLIRNYLRLHLQKIAHPKKLITNAAKGLTLTNTANIIFGTGLIAFALYNIHIPANITDGGGLGLILLLNHWFNLPPFLVAPAMDLILYIVAIRFLGIKFLKISILSTISLAIFLRLFGILPTVLPNWSEQPLVAALVGGILVGVGAGLVFRQGGSCGGDDALVITVSKLTKWRISIVYLIIDSGVLLLSMTYITPSRIIFSLITAVTSSLFLDLTCSLWRKKAYKEGNKNKLEKSSKKLTNPLTAKN
jgi:uncharacterized membrane-anchored protein YitT (DUF2179 family)